MPRPGVSRGAASAPKSSNPFRAWREKREAKKQETLEQAARMVTDQTANNENLMIDTLGSIDFLHSRLPQEVLDHKTNPEQPCGDLEYTVLAIRTLLKKNPVSAKMDIRKLDEKLLGLTLLLKEDIEQGDLQAAYAAKAGLLRGINDIRNRIPQHQPELTKLFVEQNAAYLDGWLTLVGTAKTVDMKERNLVVGRRDHESKRKDVRQAEEAFQKIILSKDSEEALAYYEIRDNDLPEQRLQWTDAQREVHRKMVQMALDKNVLDLRTIKLDQDERELATVKATLEMLFTSVSAVPVVVDPNQLEKQKEEIERMMRQLSETDVLIDESLKAMDDMEGRLAQLDTAPGTLRAKEVAAEAAERLAKQLENEQKLEAGGRAKKLEAYRKKANLFTEEEQEARVEEFNAQQQAVLEQVFEQEEETEGLLNYN